MSELKAILFIVKKSFGTGQGVIFSSGSVVIEWSGDITSHVHYKNIEDVIKLHKDAVIFI
jgi:hypothetical protein